MAPSADMSKNEEVDPEEMLGIYFEVAALAMNAGGEESDKVFAGPIGAIGGQAIHTIVQLAHIGKTELDESQIEKIGLSGVIERGIVQEAAFQAVCNMSDDAKSGSGVNDRMTEAAVDLYPKLKRIEHALCTLAAGACLEMGLPEKLHPKDEPPRRELTGLDKPPPSISDPTINPAFVAAMLKPTYDAGAEGSFDFIGPILERGLYRCTSVDYSAADPAVEGILEKLEKSAEHGLPPLASMIGCLARGIMGFAALEAFQRTDIAVLEKEHIFDKMKFVIQEIGPLVMNVGPSVIDGLMIPLRAADQSNH